MSIKILNGSKSVFYDLDTDYQNGNVVGRISWDQDNATAQLGLNTNVVSRLGQDDMWYVKNQTGSTIQKGTVVSAVGTVGSSGRILIAPSIGDGSVPSRLILGIAAETIVNGSDGYVLAKGKLRGVNTSSYSDGDVLWLNPSVAGGLTTTEPEAPNLKVPIAFVVHSSGSNGVLAVRTDAGTDIRHDSGVQIVGTPSTGQLLRYNSNRWENWTPNFALSGTSITINGTSNQVNVIGGTQDLSANRTWTLSLPQNIHTGATPTFAGLSLSVGSGGSFLTLNSVPSEESNINFNSGGTTLWTLRRTNFGGGDLSLIRRNSSGAFVEHLLYAQTSNGFIGLANSAPTQALDINGNIRVRSLTTSAGDFITTDANGVFSRRTAAQVRIDLDLNTNYIQNQSAGAQSSSNAWVSGFLQAGNLRLTGNTISAQNTNGDVLIIPNGSGILRVGNNPQSFGIASVNVQNALGGENGIALLSTSKPGDGFHGLYVASNRDSREVILSSSGTGGGSFTFKAGNTSIWRMTTVGILEAVGAQTIRTSTGNLTLATNAGDGDIRLTPHGTGIVYLGAGTKSGIVGKLEIAYDGAANGIGIFNGTGTSFRIFRDSNNAILQRGNTPALTINTSSRLIPAVDVDNSATNGLFLDGSGVMVSRALGTGAFATIADYLTVSAAASTYAPIIGSANYIQNQTSVNQTASFRISGNGLIAGSVLIGTTTDNGVDKLQVSGTAIVNGADFKVDSGAGGGRITLVPISGSTPNSILSTTTNFASYSPLRYVSDGNHLFRASSGGRDISLSNAFGSITIKAEAGGWAMGTFFEGSGGADLGGFGSYGTGNALTYHYVGTFGSETIKFLSNQRIWHNAPAGAGTEVDALLLNGANEVVRRTLGSMAFANSGDFVLNTTSLQSSSNFHISGIGRIITNLALGSAGEFGGATRVFYMANASSEPTTPSTGGILYVWNGALKYKGSNGTETVIAPA